MLLKLLKNTSIFLFLVLSNSTPFSELQTHPFDHVSESALLDQRVIDPGIFFLIDGNHSLIFEPGRISKNPMPLFFGSTNTKSFINSKYQNDFKTELDLKIGNEVGDPHLQEFADPGSINNHTPFLFGKAIYQINSFIVWGLFDQIDHFSSSLTGIRHSLTGSEETAWFGENLPTSSTIESGFQIRHKLFTLSSSFISGWVWNTSYSTGALYPWKLTQMQIKSKILSQITFSGSYTKKKSELKNSSTNDVFEKWEGYLGWGLNTSWSEDSLNTKIKVGVKNIDLIVENQLNGDNQLFPAELNANYINYLNQTNISLTSGINIFSGFGPQNLEEYLSLKSHFKKSNGTLKINMFQSFLNSQNTVYTEMVNQHSITIQDPNSNWGLSGNLSYSFKTNYFEIFLESKNSYINQIQYFALDSTISSGPPVRIGNWKYTQDPVFQLYQWSQVSFSPYSDLKLSLSSKTRQWIESKEKLDYQPSPYVFGMNGILKTKSNFKATLQVNYVGPKQVRNWLETGSFDVDGHWENNLTLYQTFLKEKISLYYTALHMFGDEIKEHPMGNPLRFRIIAGLKMRL